jgi:GNAT superfamily N-acetyltransferase
LIRQARAEDRAAIQRLYEFLCPGEPVKVIASRIEEIQNDDRHYLLVHQTDKKVDGSVFVNFCPDPMYGTLPYTVVENLIVDPAHRRTGIARRLMLEVERLTREHRSTKIMLLSGHQRDEAHHFFKSAGYDGQVSLGFKKYLGDAKEHGHA